MTEYFTVDPDGVETVHGTGNEAVIAGQAFVQANPTHSLRARTVPNPMIVPANQPKVVWRIVSHAGDCIVVDDDGDCLDIRHEIEARRHLAAVTPEQARAGVRVVSVYIE